MIVAVSGCRHSQNDRFVRSTLWKLHTAYDFSRLRQGGCTGVDTSAAIWALYAAVPNDEYPANWDEHGKKAGPIRNENMIQGADMLVAFPSESSRGTVNAINIARRLRIPTLIFPLPAN